MFPSSSVAPHSKDRNTVVMHFAAFFVSPVLFITMFSFPCKSFFFENSSVIKELADLFSTKLCTAAVPGALLNKRRPLGVAIKVQ